MIIKICCNYNERKFFMNLNQCLLFKQYTPNQITMLLHEIHAYKKTYSKNHILAHPLDHTDKFGILLKGKLHIKRTDYNGNQILLSEISENDLFMETFALAHEPLHVSVITQSECEILWIPTNHLFSNQIDKSFLINLTQIMAQKNLFLSQRVNHLSKRKAEEKILSFLNDYQLKNRSSSFMIPFTRQQMADYLGMDRSALSFVLTKLKKKKILDFHKNHFILY